MLHSNARITAWLRSLRARGEDGVVAIEYAIVAIPFLLLLLGIFEIGLIFFASSTLQGAVDMASRHIRTGDLPSDATKSSQAVFRAAICDNVKPLLDCSAIQIDVESFTQFSVARMSPPLSADGSLDTELNKFDTGTACQVVIVRAFYAWPTFCPLLQALFANMKGGNHLLTGTAAFRNEPFEGGGKSC